MEALGKSRTLTKEDAVNEILGIIRAHQHEERQWIVSMLTNFIKAEIEKECKETEEKLKYLISLLHKENY